MARDSHPLVPGSGGPPTNAALGGLYRDRSRPARRPPGRGRGPVRGRFPTPRGRVGCPTNGTATHRWDDDPCGGHPHVPHDLGVVATGRLRALLRHCGQTRPEVRDTAAFTFSREPTIVSYPRGRGGRLKETATWRGAVKLVKHSLTYGKDVDGYSWNMEMHH